MDVPGVLTSTVDGDDVSGSLVQHLAHALHLHRKWCRQCGIPFPPLLDALMVDFSASDGHARPNLGDLVPALDPLLMDYSAVAHRLSVSERTVRRLVAAGTLPAVRIGNRSLIKSADVDTYVDGVA
jgi:excisionase family DNA binding protein